jgi:cation:H+ antiporter
MFALMQDMFMLTAGFVLLILSGNFLVRAAVAVANQFGLPQLVIGVTVVSFGTSLPELLVSLQAALKGHPDMSIGNVVGSNIANIALVLGLVAVILPVPVKKHAAVFDWPIMMFASLLFYAFILNGTLHRWEGLVFIGFLVAYLYLSIWYARTHKRPVEEQKTPGMHIGLAVLLILVSSGGLALGASWLVDGAAEIARMLNVSERVISITMVAFGTSVPELATSAIAAIRKEMDISIGNILGSNVFNLFAILGITSIVVPIPVAGQVISFDIFWMLGIALLLFLFMFPLNRAKINRLYGTALLFIYAAYVYMLFL